ncbi:hypothetical protein [Aquabacterium sp.]|uniref:hypothetical protein n=1 Tax=Aquabacterium sp. TaxID=1872578 RepID=UPI002488D659|nr:hypothetical protein [Aquabacterium sp.]MDI1260538.1 hypothetical protein [Aquabacterium sp.]
MTVIATPLSAFNREGLFLGHLRQVSETISQIFKQPSISIDLRLSDTLNNHPFYREMTRQFHRNATRRHAKLPLIRQFEFGVAVSLLKSAPPPYSTRLGSPAKRNLKKALRLGYRFERIDYNQHRDEITAIHRSSKIRQGRAMPEHFFTARAPAIIDPPSTKTTHDYPYFGIFKEGTLVAYASCLIAGELCSIETIYGHDAHQADGVIPLLLVSMADHLVEHHPQVAYYVYDTYFGASETMRRFKRKFLFHPHRVTWQCAD